MPKLQRGSGMYRRDYRDIIGGLLLVIVGLAFAGHAYTNYRLGTVAQMGPGMFPVVLGLVLAMLGAILTFQAFRRPGRLPTGEPLVAGLVLAGIVAFGVAIRPLGLIPAICLLVVIAAPAEGRIRLGSIAALCSSLSFLTWLIFSVGLGLPIRMFWWSV